jgi:hypothetical protein
LKGAKKRQALLPKGSFIAIASGKVWHVTLHYDGHSDMIPWCFASITKFAPMDTFFFIPPTNGTVYSYNKEMTPKQPHIGYEFLLKFFQALVFLG